MRACQGAQQSQDAADDCKFGCEGKDQTQARSIACRKPYREILLVVRSLVV
jgi:hypothetical protein